MDLRKIIALTLMIPTLRVYATGTESVENNTTAQEEKIRAKMKDILNDPNLKKEVVKSIYEPRGLRDNYDELKQELEAANDSFVSYKTRANRINNIINKIDDPILQAMNQNLLLYSNNIGFIQKSHYDLIRDYKIYLLDYIKMLTGNRNFPRIPPSVAIEFMQLIESFNNKQNVTVNDELANISREILNKYTEIFWNMQTMKELAQSKVAQKSDANLINHYNCKKLIEANKMSSDVVEMICNDQYLRDLITKEICKLAIEEIETIQVKAYERLLSALDDGGSQDTFRYCSRNGRITDPFLNNIARILAMNILERIHSRGKHGNGGSWTKAEPMCDSNVGSKFREAAKNCLELIAKSNQIPKEDREAIDQLKADFIQLCTENLNFQGAYKYSFDTIHTELGELNNKIRRINSKYVIKSNQAL